MAISEGLLIPPAMDVDRPGSNWGGRVEECWIEFWTAFACAFQLDPGDKILWVDSYDDDEGFTGSVRFRVRPWEYREQNESGSLMKQIDKASPIEFGQWNETPRKSNLQKVETEVKFSEVEDSHRQRAARLSRRAQPWSRRAGVRAARAVRAGAGCS